ncbi:hypothetical protein GCM10010275_36190 [Streptomyces litmocidini]|nr:hypothetical protein GCM10010275_36190 [Streptomyces litmocidini]
MGVAAITSTCWTPKSRIRPRGRRSSTGCTAGGTGGPSARGAPGASSGGAAGLGSGAGDAGDVGGGRDGRGRGLDTFELRSAFDTSWFSRDPAPDGEPNRFGQIDLAVSM